MMEEKGGRNSTGGAVLDDYPSRTSGIVSESRSVPARSAPACKKCAGQPEIYRFLSNPHYPCISDLEVTPIAAYSGTLRGEGEISTEGLVHIERNHLGAP